MNQRRVCSYRAMSNLQFFKTEVPGKVDKFVPMPSDGSTAHLSTDPTAMARWIAIYPRYVAAHHHLQRCMCRSLGSSIGRFVHLKHREEHRTYGNSCPCAPLAFFCCHAVHMHTPHSTQPFCSFFHTPSRSGGSYTLHLLYNACGSAVIRRCMLLGLQ